MSHKKFIVRWNGERRVADESWLREHASAVVVCEAANDSTIARNIAAWVAKAAARHVEKEGFNPISLH